MEEKDKSQREDLVAGRNPVLELLKSGRPVEAIYIQKGLTGSAEKIQGHALDRGIRLHFMTKKQLNDMVPEATHQGVVAQRGGGGYSTLEDIFKKAGDTPPFIVLADGIEDPYNLGALIRSAEAAGAHGLILPRRRSAGITYTVAKASAGALEHLPIVQVANIASTMEELKKKNIWFYAADIGGTPWCQQDYAGGVGLVVGAEGDGVSRLVRERSDFVVSLPMLGKVSSLNVSVASGIILYEIARQRLGLTSK